MDIPYTLIVTSPDLTSATAFLQGTLHPALSPDPSHIPLHNKYFSGLIPTQSLQFPPFPSLSPSTGLILLLSPHDIPTVRELLHLHSPALETLDLKMIFSLQNHPSLTDFASEFDMEYEFQDYENDSEMHTIEGEKRGLARVVEAVEVACSGFLPAQKTDLKEENREEMDEIDDFDDLLAKIKAVNANAGSLTDEERRAQAERVIMEVVQRLGLDPSE